MFELATIPPAIPNNAPPIGPPGKKNVGNKPNPPATAPIPPKNVACLGSTPYLSNTSFPLANALPNAPFIKDLLPSLKFSPYKNSWKASDFVTIPALIPNIAPVKGPPGKKKDGKNPTPAPIAPPIFICCLFSEYKSCNDLGINPPKRLFGSSGSFSPNNQFLNLSDCIKKEAAVPVIIAPIAPPGKNNDPSNPALLNNNPFPIPVIIPVPIALGNLDFISLAKSCIFCLLNPASDALPNIFSLNL